MAKGTEIKVAPSVLSADFAHLHRDLKKVEDGGADYLHLDIMDGVFVPNISFGFPVVRAILSCTDLPLDIHLMTSTTGLYAPRFWKLGLPDESVITIHSKNCPDLPFLVRALHNQGIRLGLAYNPEEEELPYLRELAGYIERVLIMSVYPGYGGQRFIPGSEKRVALAKKIKEESGSNYSIAVDGGINYQTGKLVKESGATDLVVGNFLFSHQDYEEVISKLKE